VRNRLAKLSLARLDLDRWAVVYLVVSGFYPLLRPGLSPDPLGHVAGHLLLAVAIWFLPPLMRCSRYSVVRLLGEIYLPFIFPMFYAEMKLLGVVFHGFHDSFDPWLISFEENLLGCQPSLVWSRLWPWPWFHELMEFAYFTYYFYTPVPLLMIFRLRGVPDDQRWPAARAFIRDMGATMLLCYSMYTFFPAWGPKFFRTGPIPVEGWIFTDIMHSVHANGAILGAAFPSSHVAGSMMGWWHVWRWFPRHRWWVTTFWVLLCASTVYCRYHYVVDVVAGLMLGSLVIWLGHYFGETGSLFSDRLRNRLPTWRPRR